MTSDVKSENLGTHIDTSREYRRKQCEVLRKNKKYVVLREKRLQLCNEEYRLRDISSNEVQDLALKVKKEKVDITCLQDIRRALCCTDHIEYFLRVDGALYALTGILTGKDANKQLEAAACITNLATGSHKSTYKIAKMTGSYLVSFLQGSSRFMQDQCAWAAGNIIMDCKKCYSLLKAQGILPALLSLLQSPHPDVIESTTFAFHACTKYEDQDISDLLNVTETFFHLFNNLEVHHSAKIDTALALTNICRKIQEKPDALQFETGDLVLNYLTKVMQSEYIDVLLATPLVRCLGNLSSGSDALCIHLLSHIGFKGCMDKIMSSQFHHLKKEFLWVLSNFLACKDGSVMSFLDLAPLLNNILIFLNPLDNAVMQALYLLCVLVHQDNMLCQQFINKGFITQIESLMKCNQPDAAHAAKTLYELIFSTL